MLPNFYAGIGSRETPPAIIEQMVEFAVIAGNRNWVLRSGAANGADAAFERGCDEVVGGKEIFLPWSNFNNHPSVYSTPSPAASALAATTHPAWNGLSPVAKKLVSRNMHQVFGQFMIEPVRFVICWTKDGCESYKTYGRQTGGTGSAIAAASKAGIPVYNLANEGSYYAALKMVIELKEPQP